MQTVSSPPILPPLSAPAVRAAHELALRTGAAGSTAETKQEGSQQCKLQQ